MNIIEKNKIKRKSKITGIISLILIVITVGSLAVGIMFENKMNDCSNFNVIILITISIISGIIFSLISQKYDNNLKKIRSTLNENRTRHHFQRLLLELEWGSVDRAIEIFNKSIPSNHEVDGIVFGLILSEMKYSGNPELVTKYNAKILDMKKYFAEIED